MFLIQRWIHLPYTEITVSFSLCVARLSLRSLVIFQTCPHWVCSSIDAGVISETQSDYIKLEIIGKQCYRWHSAQSTLCMLWNSSLPPVSLLLLACMQMQEGNLRPVTKETKQVLAWVILSLEGIWVNFLWWKVQWWLIHFWHSFSCIRAKELIQIKPYFFPQYWLVKAENDSLLCSLGLQENPCTPLRKETEASEWIGGSASELRKNMGDKSVIWPSRKSWKRDWMLKRFYLVLNPTEHPVPRQMILIR